MSREPEFTKLNFLSVQVCVPAEFTDDQVEGFANDGHPTGITSRWTVYKDGPDLERATCLEREDCVHIVLTC
jgi:hypothetical protein